MKKTSNKYLLRTIKENIVSFFAVAFIAGISIAIYIGLQSGATAFLKAANQYFASNKLPNYEIYCGNGITAEDIKSISDLEGVDVAEGGYSATVRMAYEEETLLIQALSLGGELNLPIVLEGQLPVAANEVAIEEKFAQERNIQVGDMIQLAHDGSLTEDIYCVTAVINQPSFCCKNIAEARGNCEQGTGAVEYYIVLSQESFNQAYYNGAYTKALLWADELNELYCYSEEYAEREAELLEKIKELGVVRAQGRYEDLLEAYQAAGVTVEESGYELFNQEWIFATRNDIGDLRGMSVLVSSIYGLSYIMSIIFVLVAIIVCYAAISRMIYEKRGSVGVQKALGFTPDEILKHYMRYNFLCAILGVILGCLIGIFIVEVIVVGILKAEFLLPSVPWFISWQNVLVAAAVCIVIFMLTSYLACRKLSKQPATVLLQEEVRARKKGFFFERYKIYKKLSLYSRTMIKNVLSDKERIFSTVMGVVGCIALLVICFGLKLGIENSSKEQFNRYFLYENRLVFDSDYGQAEDFEEILKNNNISYTRIQDKLRNFRIDEGKTENGHFVSVSNSKQLDGFMMLEDIKTGKPISAPEDGVLVSRKCAEIYKLAAGSEVEVMNSRGEYKTLTVVGVIEHYLAYPLFVTTDDYYEKAMGEKPDACVFLLKGEVDGLSEQVKGIDGFLSLSDNSKLEANADEVNMVIAICLVLAAAMSLLVLLNQIVMQINRKFRELAIMRINGYTLKETRAYVYKDNIVLTVTGLILGCAIGSFLAYLSIRIMEGEVNRYVREISPIACLLGIGVGALFALIVNIIALRKIKTLSLISIHKN